MLELELQGAQAAPAEADPRHHPALAQELGHKAGGQGHSYRRRLQVTGSAQREVGGGRWGGKGAGWEDKDSQGC